MLYLQALNIYHRLSPINNKNTWRKTTMETINKRGRPKKETIEYFSHYAVKPQEVSILQKKFGYNKGYRVYFELMELLGRSPNQILDYSNKYVELYIADELRLELNELEEILIFMAGLDILCSDCFKEGYIFSDGLMKRLIKLYNKRKNQLPKHVCGKTIDGADDDNDESDLKHQASA